MPGLYVLESNEDAVFAPAPRFPAASETTRDQMQVAALTAHETRKRSRPSAVVNSDTHAAANPWQTNSQALSGFASAKSPPPLANDRYHLAGGMERPEMPTPCNGNYDDYFNLEKQRGMWSTAMSPAPGLQNQLSSSDIPPPEESKPWVLNQIMKVVGGVAGTLAHFVQRPFRGFQAGGGQAYTFSADGAIAPTETQNDVLIDRESRRSQLPGEFPQDNHGIPQDNYEIPQGNHGIPSDDYGVLSVESLESERPRLAKRIRTGEAWVMVDQEGRMESRPSTPRLSERRVPNTQSASQIPRPVSRAGPVSAQTLNRPSLIPVSRRCTKDRMSLQGSTQMPSKPVSSPRAYNRQHYGSPAMFQDTTNVRKSPLPTESHRLINKMKREEIEDEARMRRMSQQMSQMLRDAQAALGSKVTVEEDYSGNGGMDGDDGYS